MLRRAGARLLAAADSRTGLAPRLEPRVPGAGLSAEQRALYDRIYEDRSRTGKAGGFPVTNPDGSLAGPWNAQVASPVIGSLMERMGHHCRHSSACAPDLYEVGILAVGAEWRSQFEWYAHERLARKAGVSDEAIESIRTGVPPDAAKGMTPQQRAVYAYTLELGRNKRVSDAAHAAALAAVGSERALVDLVFTVGFYHQVCAVLNAFNVPLPPGAELPLAEPSAAP
eukprot:TRINITY_DN14260_c0_g1_i1.p2 TRINITY_DN14260_c0_g1~~TRINITY_DN14260_c0_g1_i1.p2  ORF type:complete len:252 (+),score=84.23 TRINITY_DN14260_c0_g1_i1:77-757(+)